MSSTATINPKMVVTSRYCRVPHAKWPSASLILGRSAAMEASRSPAPPVSTLRNSSRASRNTKFDASPATLPNTAPSTAASVPRFSELPACLSCSGPTPERGQLGCQGRHQRIRLRGVLRQVGRQPRDGEQDAEREREQDPVDERISTTAWSPTPGQPWRLNQLCTGETAITTMSAMKAGPISQAVACTPAMTTTAEAAPTRMISARGMPTRRAASTGPARRGGLAEARERRDRPGRTG